MHGDIVLMAARVSVRPFIDLARELESNVALDRISKPKRLAKNAASIAQVGDRGRDVADPRQSVHADDAVQVANDRLLELRVGAVLHEIVSLTLGEIVLEEGLARRRLGKLRPSQENLHPEARPLHADREVAA